MKIRERYGLSFYKRKNPVTGKIEPICIQEEGCKYSVLEFISRLTEADFQLLIDKTNIFSIIENDLSTAEKLDFIKEVDVTISFRDIKINGDDYPVEQFHDLLKEWKSFVNAKKQIELKSNSWYTAHAGLVLLTPYLPRLFSHFKTPAKHDRSVYLLRYIATGIEEQLINKPCLENMLCGFPPDHIPVQIAPLTDAEKSTGTGLLNAVLSNWPPLQKASIQSLRETFINRPGMLLEPEDITDERGIWTLAVDRNPLDILVDQLPWGFSFISHQWMGNSISVDW